MRRILTIDDDADMQAIISLALELVGWEALSATTGQEGLRQAGDAPDAILLDLTLPDIGGLDVLQKLREQHAEIPVLLCSARISQAEREEMIARGAAGVIEKPFDAMNLGNLLAERLGWEV